MNNSIHKGLSYARRMYLPRTVGLGIGFFSVAAAVYPSHPPAWVWALMLFHGYAWPHVAYQLARFSSQPYQAERRTLIYDSLAGGFWAGAMGFNPLPTVTALSMMAMNNIAAGGPRLFVLGCIAQLAGSAVGYWILTPVLFPDVTQIQIYACLPMLVIYPLAIGLVCYRVAVQLSRSKKALEKLSTTDSLTGLMNHGAWKDLLTVEFNNCQTLNRQNSVALIDIDHFKSINDTYGHIIGDNVLKQLGGALTASLRETDLAGRYGGDEFCVILPDTTLAQAGEILERLRRTVHEHTHSALPNLKLSLSIGIAAYGPHLTDAGMWLHEADMALYDAKSTGRNRVTSAQPGVKTALMVR
ncbi:diguanylate cyclase [Pseudomonas putida]|jgi:diguanylate cyclase|uniref:diguanylate cyclase n=1 Tax=Pseudomonas putida TaxID=303 RepID=UPI0023649A3D|nr:diguanylate cyclase [Pseudomonas putida]MDD1967385.1 diguanylate cyclase [Pseudomonas putida]